MSQVGDDKLARLTDLRKQSYAPLASHRLRTQCFAACTDDEAIYVGGDNGDVRILDFSQAANAHAGEVNGGFNSRQKAALAAAIEAVSRQPPRHGRRADPRSRSSRE